MLFMLLLTTSAWLFVQHSRNLAPAFQPRLVFPMPLSDREGVGGGDPERPALFQVPTIPFPVLRAAVERKKAMGIARPSDARSRL